MGATAAKTTTTNTTTQIMAGRWVTPQDYADQHAISVQTLSNWRFKDKRAGRTSALPGYPDYKRFGKCVRYWVDAATNNGTERTNHQPTIERRSVRP